MEWIDKNTARQLFTAFTAFAMYTLLSHLLCAFLDQPMTPHQLVALLFVGYVFCTTLMFAAAFVLHTVVGDIITGEQLWKTHEKFFVTACPAVAVLIIVMSTGLSWLQGLVTILTFSVGTVLVEQFLNDKAGIAECESSSNEKEE